LLIIVYTVLSLSMFGELYNKHETLRRRNAYLKKKIKEFYLNGSLVVNFSY